MIGKREARCSAASTMGGEDGPANVAVGGHGCKFPPTDNKCVTVKNHVSDRC